MNEIGIRIFWGPWDGKFNPSPIVSVGNIVGNIVPTAPALVNEELSWMIKLDEWKAVYSCFSKENCVNSDSYMQLLVCVVIPKGRRLAGEKSPLDVLEAIRNQVEQLFAFDLDTTLPPKEKVDADFIQLLKDYALTDCPWYVFNMEGSNPASFCVESRAQLDALMRFNAYPVLAYVEHLELGFKCKTTVNVNTKGGTGSNTKTKDGKRWWGNKLKEEKPDNIKSEEVALQPDVVKPKKEENTSNVNDNKEQIEPNKIALYIGGTRFRHGGFGYILSVGVLAGKEHEGEIDMPPISRVSTDENPVITIKNAENYVYYKLWDNSIDPSDDVNYPGRLAIGMTMPSNARLKDGKSPYNLLMDIYQKFLELGTAQINGNQRVFLHVDLDKSDFVRIIEQYPFEKVPVKVEAMRGTTIAEICVPQEKMEDFFRDTQYPEFVNYKAVEVTTKGKNMFPNLPIPRPISYDVEKDVGNKDKKDKDEENNNKSGKDNHRNVFILIGVIGLVVGVLVRIGYMKVVENKLIKQETVCYHRAFSSSDTLLMKNYLRDYSASQFKYPNKGHLTEIEEKLNLARMEAEAARKAAEAEAEAYSKCKDESKSLDERILACEEYIKADYKSKGEISQLKNDLEDQRTATAESQAEFEACRKAQSQPYPKNYQACISYKRGGYSNEKKGKEVEEYIAKIMKGREDILRLLNEQKLNDFNNKYGKDKWNEFITKEERNAFVLILKPNYGDPIRNHEISCLIRDEFGFPERRLFNNWDEVMKLKRRMDEIWESHHKQ